MLHNLGQGKALFKVQATDIRSTDAHRILCAAAACKGVVGSQRISFQHEKIVVLIALTGHQFIHKRKIHIIIQCV